MFSYLNNASVYKTFSVSGETGAGHNAAGGAAVVTVPAGWCAVIQSIFLKNVTAAVTLLTGTTEVCKTAWNNPYAFSGSAVWVGASGDDVMVYAAAATGGIYAVSGYLVPANYVSRITS